MSKIKYSLISVKSSLQCPHQVFLHPLPVPIGLVYFAAVWQRRGPGDAELASTSACLGPPGWLKWGCRWPHCFFLLLSQFLLPLLLLWPSVQGCSVLQPGRKLHPFLLGRL